MNLADVYEAYREDPEFDHLRTEGIVLVPGEGASQPNLFIVGEAPGAMENTHQRPFVGASGRVLRSLITDTAGLKPADYFITNVVKYRPPGNRTPDWHEIEASVPCLRQEYNLLGSPRIIVAVGGTAYSVFKPTTEKRGILKAAGERLDIGERRWTVPMIHPAYGLRNHEARPLMERHWEELGRWYREEWAR